MSFKCCICTAVIASSCTQRSWTSMCFGLQQYFINKTFSVTAKAHLLCTYYNSLCNSIDKPLIWSLAVYLSFHKYYITLHYITSIWSVFLWCKNWSLKVWCCFLTFILLAHFRPQLLLLHTNMWDLSWVISVLLVKNVPTFGTYVLA